MGRKERRESVICDKADLPAGYVPLGTLATDSGSTPLYGYVQRAYERGEWSRSLFRCRGKRFIHKDDLARLTAEFNSRQVSDSVDAAVSNDDGDLQHVAACVSLASIDATLDEIYMVLQRLTTAVESIVTQPHPAEQAARQEIMATIGGNGTWRDMNGESH